MLYNKKVPKSGSAFVYIYVTIGELIAFMMGWDLILEYIIGVSSVSNALSQYIDFLSSNKIKKFLISVFPFYINGLGQYFDLLAFSLCIVVTSKLFLKFINLSTYIF